MPRYGLVTAMVAAAPKSASFSSGANRDIAVAAAKEAVA